METPNDDIWGKLPESVCWVRARVEEHDIPRLYVIGSLDWKEVFGSYRLIDIAAKVSVAADDKHQHSSRIVEIGTAYCLGRQLEPIAMVAYSGEGPYVVINGNHRLVGMHRVGLLVGAEVYLGLHANIGSAFEWFRWSVVG